jgi:hypothetical protein
VIASNHLNSKFNACLKCLHCIFHIESGLYLEYINLIRRRLSSEPFNVFSEVMMHLEILY